MKLHVTGRGRMKTTMRNPAASPWPAQDMGTGNNQRLEGRMPLPNGKGGLLGDRPLLTGSRPKSYRP